MTSHVQVIIDDEDRPTNIPDCATIIAQCIELGPQQTTDINVTGVHIALEKTSDSDVSDIWVKFGPCITMGEARTQRFVAQYIQANNISHVRAPRVYLAFMWGHRGYIVSEFIDGPMCDRSDIALVAAAVQALIAIPSPSSRPGPVGGGLIEHPFFSTRNASIEYESVEDLEDHVNGILRVARRKRRVRLREEVASYGLRLCVSDLNFVNFMRDKEGGIVAVDYGGYSFLPPSFFAMAGFRGTFSHERFVGVEDPLCRDNLNALLTAAGMIVQCGTNNIGVPKRLRVKPQAP